MAAKRAQPTTGAPTIGLANSLMAEGRQTQAEQVVRWLVQTQPKDAAPWNLLSIICNMSQRFDEALASADRAVELAGRSADHHYARGRALKSLKRLPESAEAYRQALRLAPRRVDVRVSLAIALKQMGQLDEAVAEYRQAIRHDPEYAPAWINLANALAQRIGDQVGTLVTGEDFREAEQALQRAVKYAPNSADARHNLGIVYKVTGRYDEAAHAFNHALALDGTRVDSCLQFGEVMRTLNRLDLATSLYEKWLGENPPHVDVMAEYAASLLTEGKTERAEEWLARAESMAPDSPRVRRLRGRMEAGNAEDGALDPMGDLRMYAAIVQARPDYYEGVCTYLLTLCYHDEDPEHLAREHDERMSRALEAVTPEAPPRFPPRGPGALRVGYVSQDLKRHSVTYFLEGLIEARDRSRHEVVMYKVNVNEDSVTRRLQALSDGWVDASEFSDAQLAQRCRDDGIDVLIDLSGLTGGGRMGAFQRRAAPCQLTWLGYPTTTGTRAFDMRLTDAWIDPWDQPGPASEAPLRLEGSMFCYRPGVLAAVTEPPALSRGHVTFGSFNNFNKVSLTTLRLWTSLLQAVPESHLLLKASAFAQARTRDALRRHFETAGIAGERIELEPFTPGLEEHLKGYGRVDIAVDTFPYNGATTTCEALMMGVPVVSLAGRTHPSRMGLSILSAAGRGDWVARDEADYVVRASDLARDVGRLAAWRAEQRELLGRSRLLDAQAFACAFQEAIETASRQCSGRRDARDAA